METDRPLPCYFSLSAAVWSFVLGEDSTIPGNVIVRVIERNQTTGRLVLNPNGSMPRKMLEKYNYLLRPHEVPRAVSDIAYSNLPPSLVNVPVVRR